MDLVVPSEDSCTPQNDYIKPFGGLMVPSERCTVGLEEKRISPFERAVETLLSLVLREIHQA